MDDCSTTKHLALQEKTPITTRYGSEVKISADIQAYTEYRITQDGGPPKLFRYQGYQ